MILTFQWRGLRGCFGRRSAYPPFLQLNHYSFDVIEQWTDRKWLSEYEGKTSCVINPEILTKQ